MHRYAGVENLTLLQYITKYKQYIDFEKLSSKEYITRDIIDVYADKLDWKLISMHNTSLTVSDLIVYRNYIDWELLSENKELIKKSDKIQKLIKKQLKGES